jgi:hypothetical protein
VDATFVQVICFFLKKKLGTLPNMKQLLEIERLAADAAMFAHTAVCVAETIAIELYAPILGWFVANPAQWRFRYRRPWERLAPHSKISSKYSIQLPLSAKRLLF